MFRDTYFYKRLKRISPLRFCARLAHKSYKKIFRDKPCSFHGNITFRKALSNINEKNKISAIVETGTLIEETTKLFAKMFPKINVYTCEIDKEKCNKAKKNFLAYKNIKQELP